MSDLILNVPVQLHLIKAVKDAEACVHCGGIRPELYWTGYNFTHKECAQNAREARKNGCRPERGISVNEFMDRLAARPNLLGRLRSALTRRSS